MSFGNIPFRHLRRNCCFAFFCITKTLWKQRNIKRECKNNVQTLLNCRWHGNNSRWTIENLGFRPITAGAVHRLTCCNFIFNQIWRSLRDLVFFISFASLKLWLATKKRPNCATSLNQLSFVCLALTFSARLIHSWEAIVELKSPQSRVRLAPHFDVLRQKVLHAQSFLLFLLFTVFASSHRSFLRGFYCFHSGS